MDRDHTVRTGPRATRVGLLAVAAPVAAWAFANTIVKLTPIPVLEFTVWRVWMGAAMMLVVCAAAGRRLTWPIVKASAPAGVLFAANLVVFFAALRKTGIADVLLIQALQPALVLLVAGRLFGEVVTRREIALTAVSVAGVAVSILGASSTATWSLEGDVLAVVALFVFTGYFMLSKRVRQDVAAIEYMTTVALVASVVVTPLAIGTGTPLGDFRPIDWAWLSLFVAAVQGGHILLAWAHSQVDVSVSSLIILAEPVLAAVAALLVLNEPLTWLQVGGGLVAIVAVGVVLRQATRTGSIDETAPAEVTPA